MSVTVDAARGNPYVGPRAYEEGERLYGRDRDIARVTDLLIAERIVLLYSPSGAGKTSLIRAAIVPELRREDFVVLPIIRVSRPLPPVLHAARNRYVMSTLLSLEEGVPAESQLPLDRIVTMTLGDYLEERHAGADGLVLIFDQFEELLTADPTDVEDKAAFLDQVGAVLRDRGRWALFAMREDWIAGLDPFTRAIPTRLANTYRLDLLGVADAREAITHPAADAGVRFSDAAATKLVNDLRCVRVQRQDGPRSELGPSVEPVQLQVVCRRLWAGLTDGATEVDASDIAEAGDVDAALGDYYAERVAAAAAQSGVSERAIRDWIEHELVTDTGFRDQVLHGPAVPDGQPGRSEAVLRELQDAHLLRAETGRGAAWYELAHDRLIEPIIANNAAWRDQNLAPFQGAAAIWEAYRQPDSFLLSGDALVEAELWAADPTVEMTPLEAKFIDDSRAAAEDAKRERRNQKLLRLATVAACIVTVLALVALAATWYSYRQASRERDRADQQSLIGAAIASTAGIADPNPRILLPLAAHELLEADELDPTLRSALYAGITGTPIEIGFKAGVPIHGIAYTPAGDVALVRDGGAISLWDPATGEHVRDVVDGFAGFNADREVHFSRNGRFVAVPDVDGAYSIVDPESGVVRDQTDGGAFVAAAFSGDGRSFAYATERGVVVTTERGTADDREIAIDPPVSIALDRAGRRVVTLDVEGTVTLSPVPGPIPSLEPVDVVQAATQVVQTVVEDGNTTFVEFSPADDTFVTATLSGELIVWDAASGTERMRLSGHDGGVFDATFNPAGTVLVSWGADNTLRMWNLTTGAELASVARVVIAGAPTQVAFDPRDPTRFVVASGFGAGVMRVPEGHAGAVLGLASSGDGNRVASAGTDGVVRIWNARGQLVQALVAGDSAFPAVALTVDGSTAVASGEDNTVYVFDVASGTIRQSLGAGGRVWAVAVDDSARYAAAAGEFGVQIWDIGTGEQVATMFHAGTVFDVAFRPGSNGRELVTASQDRTAVWWRLEPGGVARRLDTFRSDDAGWFALAISPDGDRLALGQGDGDVVLQDLEGGGARQRELELHAGTLYDIAFSADGTSLVSASADGRAIVVDLRAGERFAQITSPPTLFFAALFAPDGETLLIGGSDGKVYRVPLDDDELIATAQAVVTRSLEAGECERYLLTECPLE